MTTPVNAAAQSFITRPLWERFEEDADGKFYLISRVFPIKVLRSET
jgi:hypothetical protein